jgi:hypothetical protein
MGTFALEVTPATSSMSPTKRTLTNSSPKTKRHYSSTSRITQTSNGHNLLPHRVRPAIHKYKKTHTHKNVIFLTHKMTHYQITPSYTPVKIYIYQIHTPEPTHMVTGYDLVVDPSLYQLTPKQTENPKKKAKQTARFNLQDDDGEPPPVTLIVTHREKIFTQPAATTTTILSQPRQSRRASQAEREQFVKKKLPLDLQ